MSHPHRICGRQLNILCPLYWNYFLLGFLFWNSVRFQAVPLKIALMNDSLGFSRGVPLKRNIVNNGFIIKISSGKWPLTPLTPCLGTGASKTGKNMGMLWILVDIFGLDGSRNYIFIRSFSWLFSTWEGPGGPLESVPPNLQNDRTRNQGWLASTSPW